MRVETIVKDLSNHTWTYKVGLHGLSNKFYSSVPVAVPKWEAQSIPTNRTMSWYKTTFKTPLGKDPVVVDLEGLGKGFSWVNGHNIGGNPLLVSFKTVRPGTICASVAENKTMELSCDKHPISSIQFVGFGDNTLGTCGAFETSNCAACVGKNSCSVPATRALFGTPANCIGANEQIRRAGCLLEESKFSEFMIGI
ncbi:galactosidase [Lithospermum erythrorhizon]|uniref:Galactosidase n=1 Tax=Lithospermum erythrorhizon TaxID=34254 RepID=A0AAV3P6H0_LITER